MKLVVPSRILKIPTKQSALQRQNTEISKQIFPGKEYRGLSPNFHIHASLTDEAALFPEKEYISGIFVAVRERRKLESIHE